MVGVAKGAVPRHGNPYYLPEMEYPERILSGTPTGQNIPISTMTILGQDISTIPHLTPHLKTLLDFHTLNMNKDLFKHNLIQ